MALAGLPEVLFKLVKLSRNYRDKEKQKLVKKSSLVGIGIILSLLLLVIQPLRAQTSSSNSESERLQKLERAVEQLQKRNAELEQEVSSLKKQSTSEPGGTGKRKTGVTYNGKSYVEKSVAVEENPGIFVTPRGSEFKLVLGGYIQMNLEDGKVSAFEGRLGQPALKDRFRLRRTRINLTGDFAENFDFKVEGEFENSDGISSNRTDFSGTDIFINWHQFAEANVKVGQWKAPFGLEQLTPDPTLIIIERSLPTGAITPERQVGVQVWGKPFTNIWPAQKDLLTYYAGIFNVNGRTVAGVPPGFADFTTNGFYVTAAYFLIPKKLQAAVRWEQLNPGQKGNDGIHSITGGLNYYIHGDDLKLMANYIHTWSDFRQANPQFGDDQFNEVIVRLQLMF